MTKPTSSDLSESSKPVKPARTSSSSALVVRIILIGILIVGVILLIMDLKSRSASQDLHNALQKAIDESNTMNNVEVQKLADRKPNAYVHPADEKTYIEEYTWKGVFHTYTVYCYYQVAADKLLSKVALNDPQHQVSAQK